MIDYEFVLPFVYTFLIVSPWVFDRFLFKQKKAVLCLDMVSLTGATNPMFKHDKVVLNLKTLNQESEHNNYLPVNEFQELNKHYNTMNDSSTDILNDIKKAVISFKKSYKYDKIEIIYYTNSFASLIEKVLCSKRHRINTNAVSVLYGNNFQNQKYIKSEPEEKQYNRSEKLFNTLIKHTPWDEPRIFNILH